MVDNLSDFGVYCGMINASSITLQEDLRLNYRGTDAASIATRHGVSLSAVYTCASRLGLTSSKVWGSQKDAIIAEYQAGKPIKGIAAKYGHYHANVLSKLREWGVTIRTPTESCMEYAFDTTFFKSIDSHEKAYWLGFIYADGNVYIQPKNKKHVFQVALADIDRDHVAKLASSMKDARPIYQDKKSARYMVNNISLVKDLVTLGVRPRKSLTMTFPDSSIVPEQYANSFILGYFDGDGSISVGKAKSTICIVGTHSLLTEVNRRFGGLGLSERPLTLEKRSGGGCIFYLTQSGRHYGSSVTGCEHQRQHALIKLYRYLYADSPVWLNRKRALFEKALTLTYGHDWKHTASV